MPEAKRPARRAAANRCRRARWPRFSFSVDRSGASAAGSRWWTARLLRMCASPGPPSASRTFWTQRKSRSCVQPLTFPLNGNPDPTGMRSGEVRGLTWDSIDLEGKRLFIERQANRRGEEAATKTEASVRPIPLPAYLVPELKRWKLACPLTSRGLVFPGEPNAQGERKPIDADILLRNILCRALRKAGLPPLRFHDLRHMAGTLMHEAGVPLKRAQEILGHASERTTLAIYTHSM